MGDLTARGRGRCEGRSQRVVTSAFIVVLFIGRWVGPCPCGLACVAGKMGNLIANFGLATPPHTVGRDLHICLRFVRAISFV